MLKKLMVLCAFAGLTLGVASCKKKADETKQPKAGENQKKCTKCTKEKKCDECAKKETAKTPEAPKK